MRQHRTSYALSVKGTQRGTRSVQKGEGRGESLRLLISYRVKHTILAERGALGGTNA
jgi:hypothetical protein